MKSRALRTKREHRTRTRIKAVSSNPRLVVFRSNKHFYLQIIDDMNRKTLASVSDRDLGIKEKKQKRMEIAKHLGALIAKKGKEAGVTKVVFDRGHYAYHGNVKAACEGAREGGLLL